MEMNYDEQVRHLFNIVKIKVTDSCCYTDAPPGKAIIVNIGIAADVSQCKIEEELDTKIYPGTEVMADVGTHHFVKSSQAGASVLVPQPSADPHDPLVRSLLSNILIVANLTVLELVSLLENFSYGNSNWCQFYARAWPFSSSAYVSSVNEIVRRQPTKRGAIHWGLHFGPWI